MAEQYATGGGLIEAIPDSLILLANGESTNKTIAQHWQPGKPGARTTARRYRIFGWKGKTDPSRSSRAAALGAISGYRGLQQVHYFQAEGFGRKHFHRIAPTQNPAADFKRATRTEGQLQLPSG